MYVFHVNTMKRKEIAVDLVQVKIIPENTIELKSQEGVVLFGYQQRMFTMME